MNLEDIKKLKLHGDILQDDATLEKYSHDASLFEIKPEIVILPQSSEDIKKIVSFASEQKKTDPGISITARAAGTDMSGGAINTSIILDTTKFMNHIREIGTDYIVSEPGVFYRDFEKKTLEHNLLLPPFPASRELCAIGGMVGNNGAGEKTLTHGKIEDYVQEMSVVFADGNEYTVKPLNKEELKAKMKQEDFEGDLYRKTFQLIDSNYDLIKSAKPQVSKNSAGYYLWNVWDRKTEIFDLNKLLVGSQGTLGIMTSVKFKLVKPTSHSKLLVMFLHDLAHLAEIVNTILPYRPESFESYDDQTLKIVVRFMPELIAMMKSRNLFKLGWEFLPEAWMTITGGFPKLVLMAEFVGDDEGEINARMEKLNHELQKFKEKSRIIKDEEEAQKYWVIRHDSFNMLRHHIRGKRTAPFIDDIIVNPEHLPKFLPKLNKILEKYKDSMLYTVAGHVGNGNFHIIPLMDFNKPETAQIIPTLSKEVYDLVLEYHGSITAEHNDGLIRSPFLEQMYGKEIYALFKQTKKIFDPLNIFNPGKKVDASLEYAMQHLVKNS